MEPASLSAEPATHTFSNEPEERISEMTLPDNVAIVMAAMHYEWEYDSPTHLEWRNPTPDEEEAIGDNGWGDPESDNDIPMWGVVLVEPEGTKCLWRRGWNGSVFRIVSEENYDDERTIENF